MAILDTVREWIELVTGLTVVYGEPRNATSPRPVPPYASVTIRSSAPVSSVPFERTSEDPGGEPNQVLQRRSWIRQGTVRLDVFAGALKASEEYLRELSLSIRRADVRKLLWDAGVRLRHIGDLTDIPTLRDTSWGDHSQSDYQFRFVDADESPVYPIDSVVYDVEVKEAP